MEEDEFEEESEVFDVTKMGKDCRKCAVSRCRNYYMKYAQKVNRENVLFCKYLEQHAIENIWEVANNEHLKVVLLDIARQIEKIAESINENEPKLD